MINISIPAGAKKRLLTGRKYCPDDIVVEAVGGGDTDAFWVAYQEGGKKRSYKFAFAGYGWTPELLKPKYDIIATSVSYMFSTCNNMKGIDIEKLFDDLGIIFDTSNVTETDGFSYLCQYASPSVLPALDTRGTTNIRYIFYHTMELETVRKIILKNDGSQKFTKPFENNRNLVNIEFEGVIGQNGFDISGSPSLSHNSIASIINALSTTTSGLTVTLSATAVNAAFETSVGAADGTTSADWLALVGSRSNWTIALV